MEIYAKIIEGNNEERLEAVKSSNENINDIFGLIVSDLIYRVEEGEEYLEIDYEVWIKEYKDRLNLQNEIVNFFLSNYKLDFNYISNNYPDVNKIILDQV